MRYVQHSQSHSPNVGISSRLMRSRSMRSNANITSLRYPTLGFSSLLLGYPQSWRNRQWQRRSECMYTVALFITHCGDRATSAELPCSRAIPTTKASVPQSDRITWHFQTCAYCGHGKILRDRWAGRRSPSLPRHSMPGHCVSSSARRGCRQSMFCRSSDEKAAARK